MIGRCTCVLIHALLASVAVAIRHSENENLTHLSTALEQNRVLDLTLLELHKCWDPQGVPGFNYGSVDHTEMLRELNAATLASKSASPAWQSIPLRSVPSPADKIFPKHQYADILSGGGVQLSEASVCLDASPFPEEPDEYGCYFFRRSFEPLQQVHRCIVNQLEHDDFFKLWAQIGSAASDKAAPGDVFAAAQALADKGTLQADGSLEELLSQEIENWRTCAKNWWCQEFSSIERSLEIIKRVSFKEWSDLGQEEQRVVDDVKKKIVLTRMAQESLSQRVGQEDKMMKQKGPPRQIDPVLSDSTINGIVQCIGLPAAPSASVQLSTEVLRTKEALSCLPVAFDRVEVPGPPLQPLWRTPLYITPEDSSALEAYPEKHPLCGRVAVAALNKVYTSSRYPDPYSFQLAWKSAQLWLSIGECMNPGKATCRTFAYCWSLWLKFAVGHVAPACGVSTTTGEWGYSVSNESIDAVVRSIAEVQ